MIARILFPFSGQTVGGSHISSALIAKNLNPQCFKPIFVLSEQASLQQDLLRQHDLEFEVQPDLFVPQSAKKLILNLPRFLKALMNARAFLKTQRIDLVHCDNGPVQYLWFYAALLAGVPYLHVQRNPLRTTFERRIALRFAKAVIANSAYTSATLPKLPACVLREIIPPPVAPSEPLHKHHENNIVVGFLSNMQRRKRPDLFLEIASILNKERPGAFRFVMAGAFYEDNEQHLKAMAGELGLTDSLQFTGFVQNPQETLSGFDILIAPAEDEAFGRVLMEAMSLGVPVIASAAGGHSEIIQNEKTGFLCPPGDALAFAECALKLNEDKALRDRISQAAQKAANAYHPALIARRFEEIYKRILEKKGQPS